MCSKGHKAAKLIKLDISLVFGWNFSEGRNSDLSPWNPCRHLPVRPYIRLWHHACICEIRPVIVNDMSKIVSGFHKFTSSNLGKTCPDLAMTFWVPVRVRVLVSVTIDIQNFFPIDIFPLCGLSITCISTTSWFTGKWILPTTGSKCEIQELLIHIW